MTDEVNELKKKLKKLKRELEEYKESNAYFREGYYCLIEVVDYWKKRCLEDRGIK